MKMLVRTVLVLVMFAFFSLKAGHAEDLWKTVPPPAPLPQANEYGMAPVNDIQMYYEIYNASGGDPVLLLHGGLGSTLNWGNQVPELMNTHKVVAARQPRPWPQHAVGAAFRLRIDGLRRAGHDGPPEARQGVDCRLE